YRSHNVGGVWMIPELHDVGKLLGLDKHWFEDMEKPALVDGSNEDTWLAIRFHGHKKSLSPGDKIAFNELRRLDSGAAYSSGIRRAMVLLTLADGASASSRILPEQAKNKVKG